MISLAKVLRSYRHLSVGERAHMVIRWRVCPLNRIASYVPRAGSVIDLGCGHGLFSALMALDSSARQVIGVDLDADKIACAERLNLPNVRFHTGDIAAPNLNIPPADVVTILDVLYLIPFEAQEALLKVCADRLTETGTIVLKEMDVRPRWKVRLNQLEETLAVRLLKLTARNDQGADQSVQFYFRSGSEWEALFARLGMRVELIPVDRGYYHPHLLVVARKADAVV